MLPVNCQRPGIQARCRLPGNTAGAPDRILSDTGSEGAKNKILGSLAISSRELNRPDLAQLVRTESR